MDSFLCIVVPVLLIVGFLGFQAYRRGQTQKVIAEAAATYQQALQELKRDPTSAAKRERALKFGRLYSNLTREGKGVTIFDEMALKNDLDAATAGAAAKSATTLSPAAPSASVADRLRKLDDLKGQGLVTEAEYAERRKKILDEM